MAANAKTVPNSESVSHPSRLHMILRGCSRFQCFNSGSSDSYTDLTRFRASRLKFSGRSLTSPHPPSPLLADDLWIVLDEEDVRGVLL